MHSPSSVGSAPQSSLQLTSTMNAIRECTQSLCAVLQTTFDSVSSFASNVRSGVIQGDLFVDVVLRQLTLLEKHLQDLAKHTLDAGKDFTHHTIVPFLYETEAHLVTYMQTNNFFYNTFGRLVKGIVSFIRHMIGTTQIQAITA